MSTYGQGNAKVFPWKLRWCCNHEYLAQRISRHLRYPVSVLQTNVANKTSSTLGKGVDAWKPNRLEAMFSVLFLILSIHTSTVKHPKQNRWFDKRWTSCHCCLLPHLPLRHYCMMLLSLDAPSSDYHVTGNFWRVFWIFQRASLLQK